MDEYQNAAVEAQVNELREQLTQVSVRAQGHAATVAVLQTRLRALEGALKVRDARIEELQKIVHEMAGVPDRRSVEAVNDGFLGMGC